MKATIIYRAQTHEYDIEQPTVAALKHAIQQNLNLPLETQKLLAKGKQLKDDDIVPPGKIMVIASSADSIAAVKEQTQRLAESARRRAAATVSRTSVNRTTKQSSIYRFNAIKALPHLHESGRSQSYLERLANDRSIKRLMDKYKLKVGLLTEMDPRLHTKHDSKTLGLNKNAGEEILLRLRTDELDGYRDYRGVKSTLIHELVHNRVNDHPREFWDLFRDWSKEVESWEVGTRVSQDAVYIPEETDDGVEWTGATRRLGSDQSSGIGSREDRARAAESRTRPS